MDIPKLIEERFPGFQSKELEAEWRELQSRLSLGKCVEGTVALSFPFGFILDIGERFPALMLITKMDNNTKNISIGDVVAGNIYVFDEAKKEIAITQLGYEEWMKGSW